jgi:tRNA modification GTPase
MNSAAPATETMVACLTPAGKGAIATLALWGPRAWDVVRQLFRPRSASQPQLPSDPELGPVWLGRFGEDMRDEVVVAAKAAQPVPWVEVHCHGGREVVRLLLEVFAARGLRICSWQQFQQHTMDDPLRSAAVTALADAITGRTAGILLDQYHGALSGGIKNILDLWENANHDSGTRLLRSLLGYTGVGRHLTAPWQVVVAGAPNVGKSSLINALAGYQRCVVAPTPGTTRDLVTTVIAIDGWPIELTDTAGLRTEGEMLEQQGIALARQAVSAADLCLWVLDASTAPVWRELHKDQSTLPFLIRFVVNKVDLEPAWDLNQAAGAVPVSAREGRGLEHLCEALSDWLVPQPPPPGAPVPFTAPLCARIEEAWHHHAAGRGDQARQVLAKLLGS